MATAAAAAATAAAALFLTVVVVMVAVDSGGLKNAIQISLDRSVCIAICTGADFNSCACKGSLSAAADAAAKQNAYGKLGKKACKSLMTAAIGADDFGGDNAITLNFVNLKVFAVAEVLKNFAISKRNCNFHI